jgi:hypothetical protein
LFIDEKSIAWSPVIDRILTIFCVGGRLTGLPLSSLPEVATAVGPQVNNMPMQLTAIL